MVQLYEKNIAVVNCLELKLAMFLQRKYLLGHDLHQVFR